MKEWIKHHIVYYQGIPFRFFFRCSVEYKDYWPKLDGLHAAPEFLIYLNKLLSILEKYGYRFKKRGYRIKIIFLVLDGDSCAYYYHKGKIQVDVKRLMDNPFPVTMIHELTHFFFYDRIDKNINNLSYLPHLSEGFPLFFEAVLFHNAMNLDTLRLKLKEKQFRIIHYGYYAVLRLHGLYPDLFKEIVSGVVLRDPNKAIRIEKKLGELAEEECRYIDDFRIIRADIIFMNKAVTEEQKRYLSIHYRPYAMPAPQMTRMDKKDFEKASAVGIRCFETEDFDGLYQISDDYYTEVPPQFYWTVGTYLAEAYKLNPKMKSFCDALNNEKSEKNSDNNT